MNDDVKFVLVILGVLVGIMAIIGFVIDKGCSGPPVSRLLKTIEGCDVYQIEHGCQTVYTTICKDTKHASVQWDIHHPKSSTEHFNVETNYQ